MIPDRLFRQIGCTSQKTNVEMNIVAAESEQGGAFHIGTHVLHERRHDVGKLPTLLHTVQGEIVDLKSL